MEKLNPTARNVLGHVLKRNRAERKMISERLEALRAEVARCEAEVSQLDGAIIDLEDALGEEEAARWEA
nr:hypothetical protein [Brevundimonas naejangsanensis]